MANPSADFPEAIHEPVDISAKSQTPLGSTPKKHSEVHGQIEEEIKAIQEKLGIGDSKASDATPGQVPTVQDDGSTAYKTPVPPANFIFNSSGPQEGIRYNNWLDLFAAIPEDRTRIVIQFEQSESWDEPGEYNLDRITFSGNGNNFISGSSISIGVEDGVTFSSVDNFTITNGIFLQSHSHEPLAIIDSGVITVKANYLSAFSADYCEIFRQEGTGALNVNLVPGGALAQLKPFTGVGYEIINTQLNSSEGLQIRFGGFGSGIMNNTVRGDDGNFIIIKEDIGYLETEDVAIPGLGNLDSTHENYTGGTIDKLSTVKARQLDIDAIEGMNSVQVQEALEELRVTGGVNDIASVAYDVSDKIASLSGYWSGNIFAKLYLTRNGRMADGFISIVSLTDAEPPEELPELPLTTFMIRGEDLPYQPRNFGDISEDVPVPLTEPGGFGILQNAAASSAIGSAASNFGGLLGPVPALIFFNVSESTDAGISSVVSDNNPIQIIDAQWNVFARVRYEIAYAEGEEPDAISMEGTFDLGVVGESYNDSVAIVGETEDLYIVDFTVNLISGSIPSGLSLELNNGTLRLYGTPASPGECVVAISLEDNLGNIYSPAEFTISVEEAPVLGINIAGTFNNGNVNIPYSQSLAVTLDNSGLQLPITQSVVSGAVPGGLSLSIDGSNLVLSGEPTIEESSSFTVEIEDALGTTYQKTFTPSIGAYNPELEELYLGTVSGNSLNINFVSGFPAQSILTYAASPGQILKIRSGTMTHDFGEGPLNVPVDGFIIYEDGFWREYNY